MKGWWAHHLAQLLRAIATPQRAKAPFGRGQASLQTSKKKKKLLSAALNKAHLRYRCDTAAVPTRGAQAEDGSGMAPVTGLLGLWGFASVIMHCPGQGTVLAPPPSAPGSEPASQPPLPPAAWQ